MKSIAILAASALFGACPALIAGDAPQFEAPKMVHADGKPVTVESPGYAFPSLADINGDGVNDLVVGQFRSGKIAVYKGAKTENGVTFGAREWLQADGKDAAISGVW